MGEIYFDQYAIFSNEINMYFYTSNLNFKSKVFSKFTLDYKNRESCEFAQIFVQTLPLVDQRGGRGHTALPNYLYRLTERILNGINRALLTCTHMLFCIIYLGLNLFWKKMSDCLSH